MTLPTVSIIIPYYNAEKTLQRAIDSALAQTYPAIEILLVDNNSTDQSAQIAAQNKLRHSGKIKLLIESKSGSNFARNTGLKNAQGDWLQFLDADDEILPEKINHQLELMQLYPECDVIYACYSEVIPHENKNRVRIYTRRQVSSDLITGLVNSTLGCTVSNLWNKSALDSVCGWDEDRLNNQEYFLMLKLWKAERNFLLDPIDFTIAYREPDSISRPKSDASMIRLLENRLIYQTELKSAIRGKHDLTPAILAQIEAQMVQNLHVCFFHVYIFRPNIEEIANRFGLHINFRNKLKFYPHYIYSKYAFNKPLKYLRFAYYSFTNLKKLL